MDSEVRRQFERLDLRLTKAEEEIVRRDKVLSAARKLILAGGKALVAHDKRMRDFDEGIAEIKDLLKALTAAQPATEEKLQRFLERSANGHSS